MRKSILKTSLIIALMILAIAPVSIRLSRMQDDLLANDVQHTVMPMVELYAQSAINCAHTPVSPVADIEDIWAIEDARQESERPLVTGMRNSKSVLGYDAMSNTFYCSIGMDFPDNIWPQLDLYIQSADADTIVNAVFVDDYAYDYPSDAVAEGYRYELLAYTQNEYQYFGVVFTGLPIVSMHADLPIRDAYVPSCVSISSGENSDQSFTSIAKTHRRGGGYGKLIDKKSYRIEFQRLTNSGRAASLDASVLGMEPDSDWLLLANASNVEFVHNYLAFDLWNRWSEDHHLFMQQDSRMVELFINDEYLGLYQLMQRINPEQEILDAGGNPATDMVARVISALNYSDRPIRENIEYIYAAGENSDRVFSYTEYYRKFNDWTEDRFTDEEFIAFVEKHIDIENFISYFLFMQIAGLTADNAINNVYIYMLEEDGNIVFHVAPWDMDCAFFYGYFTSDPATGYRFVRNLGCVTRMLDLNIMNCREMLHRMYQERRETILSDEAIEQWITSMEETITASGAYRREMEKWYGMPSNLYLSDLLTFELEQVALTPGFYEERWPIK